MLRSDFHFDLPEELIAQQPPEKRGDSRLLCLDKDSGEYRDQVFADLPDLIHPGDLLVFNNTRVIPARLFGQKETGGKVEILIERLLSDTRALTQIRASKSPKTGSRIQLENNVILEVQGRQDDFFILECLDAPSLAVILEAVGHMPLPPYIERNDTELDKERYQTVFAKQAGAVAAPTAGLHFTDDLLQQLSDKGAKLGFVTLHVGAGTFQPVRVDDIQQHKMHSEWFQIEAELCELIDMTKQQGRRVIAVGTTSVRCLESAAKNGVPLQPILGETDIFIYPGYQFQLVDALITNFHLPESTLLMLVSAFAGRENVLKAYEHAVQERYRFFSYGDAMFLSGGAGG